jgi:hypothetical protein
VLRHQVCCVRVSTFLRGLRYANFPFSGARHRFIRQAATSNALYAILLEQYHMDYTVIYLLLAERHQVRTIILFVFTKEEAVSLVIPFDKAQQVRPNFQVRSARASNATLSIKARAAFMLTSFR